VLTVTNFASNDANIILKGGGGTSNTEATLNVLTGTFTNNGTIQSIGTLDDNILNAAVINAGTIDVDFNLGITNTGTIFDTSAGILDIAFGQDINITGGTTQIGSGTMFLSTGQLDILGGGSILELVSNFTVPTGTEIISLGGTNAIIINGPGALTNQGTLRIAADTINTTIDNDGGFLQLFEADSSITTLLNHNGATLDIRSNSNTNGIDAVLTVTNFASNDANIILKGGGGTSNTEATLNVLTGTFTNNGFIQSIGVNADNILNAEVINAGTIDVDWRLEVANGGRTFDMSSGTLDILSGTFLEINGGNFDWSGGTIENTGALNFTGATLNITGGGTRILNGPTVTGNNLTFGGGSLEVQSGTFNATGTTTISLPTTFSNTGGTFNIATPTINPGASLTVASGTINASGTTTVDGALTVSTGGTYNAGVNSVDVNGTLSLPGGAIIAGIYNINAGAILGGIGTINGIVNIADNANLSPGSSPGTLTITGDLNLSSLSTTLIEIDSTSAFDIINVTGTANLDGLLDIVAVNGVSGSFEIITCGTACNSQFATVNPISVTSTYNPLNLTLDIASATTTTTTTTTTIDAINNVIVMTDFQNDGEFTSGTTESIYPLREGEEEEEKRNLACR
jgi:fibronectin-binding autotransporter adhesin